MRSILLSWAGMVLATILCPANTIAQQNEFRIIKSIRTWDDQEVSRIIFGPNSIKTVHSRQVLCAISLKDERPEPHVLTELSRRVWEFVYCPKRQLFAIDGVNGNTIDIYAVVDNKVIVVDSISNEKQFKTSTVRTFSFSPDGRQFAAGSIRDGSVETFESSKGAFQFKNKYSANGYTVDMLRITDDAYVCAVSMDNYLRCWESASMSLKAKVKIPKTSSETLDLLMSTREKKVAVLYRTNHNWDAEFVIVSLLQADSKRTSIYQSQNGGKVRVGAFAPDLSCVAIGTSREVIIKSLSDGKELFRHQLKQAATSVAFSDDSETIAFGFINGEIMICSRKQKLR